MATTGTAEAARTPAAQQQATGSTTAAARIEGIGREQHEQRAEVEEALAVIGAAEAAGAFDRGEEERREVIQQAERDILQWVQEHPEQSVSTDDEDTSNTGTTTDEEEAAAQGQQQQQVNMAGAAGIDYDRLAAALAGSKAQLVYTGDKYEGTEDEDVEDHFNEVDDWLLA